MSVSTLRWRTSAFAFGTVSAITASVILSTRRTRSVERPVGVERYGQGEAVFTTQDVFAHWRDQPGMDVQTLLSGPVTRQRLATFTEQHPSVGVVPYYRQGEQTVIWGLILAANESTAAYWCHPDFEWEKLDDQSRENDILIDDVSWGAGVIFVGADADHAEALEADLVERLHKRFNVPEQSDPPSPETAGCTCERRGPFPFQSVALQTGDGPQTPEPEGRTLAFLKCQQCSAPAGFLNTLATDETQLLSLDSDAITFRDTVLDEEWLFESGTHPIRETGSDEAYTLISERTEYTNLEYALAMLAMSALLERPDFNKYDPQLHDGLLYIYKGRAVGYLLWTMLDDTPVLRQLYVLPECRRQGIAANLVRTWHESVRQAGTEYLVDEPTDASHALFEGLGYFDGSATPAYQASGVGTLPM